MQTSPWRDLEVVLRVAIEQSIVSVKEVRKIALVGPGSLELLDGGAEGLAEYPPVACPFKDGALDEHVNIIAQVAQGVSRPRQITGISIARSILAAWVAAQAGP